MIHIYTVFIYIYTCAHTPTFPILGRPQTGCSRQGCRLWHLLVQKNAKPRCPTVRSKASCRSIKFGSCKLSMGDSPAFCCNLSCHRRLSGGPKSASETSWWVFSNAFEKHANVKIETCFPNFRGENLKKYVKFHHPVFVVFFAKRNSVRFYMGKYPWLNIYI